MQSSSILLLALVAAFCFSLTDCQFRSYGNRYHRNRLAMARRRALYSTRGWAVWATEAWAITITGWISWSGGGTGTPWCRGVTTTVFCWCSLLSPWDVPQWTTWTGRILLTTSPRDARQPLPVSVLHPASRRCKWAVSACVVPWWSRGRPSKATSGVAESDTTTRSTGSTPPRSAPAAICFRTALRWYRKCKHWCDHKDTSPSLIIIKIKNKK